MMSSTDFKTLLAQTNLNDGKSIEAYAKHLIGMTFRDVLNLGIAPEGSSTEKNYGNVQFKGGMGNLLEERFFGYRANSDAEADFKQAGVELKVTCYDTKKNGDPSAGERLVLTMIPFDRDVSIEFDSSHLWDKCHSILLVVYERDKNIDKYDQTIQYVKLFTPPEEDLRIIREDYRKIISYIQAGRADELSEGLTAYLGAATKGATAKKSLVSQHYPFIEPGGLATRRKAKTRAFSFKRQYMDYVLHHYLMNEADEPESIIDSTQHQAETFEDQIRNLISRHVGKSARQIAEEYRLTYAQNKAQWTQIVYRMLGIKGNRAKEFVKAGISVRAIRREANGCVRESLSFTPFEFIDLISQEWETSDLRVYLEMTRFFIVVFQMHTDGEYYLQGSMFWNVPNIDIETSAKECWEATRSVINKGVQITPKPRKDGKVTYFNNLPGQHDNPMFHVRPHADKRAYLLEDGTRIGNVERDASELPDGRFMTKQSFWVNNNSLRKLFDREFRNVSPTN